jgi:hypothetical protein
MAKKKSGAGGKLGRSEIVQARLNAKSRFAAEIIATHERRTLSSLVESAIDQYAKIYKFNLEVNGIEQIIKLDELMNEIWHPDEMMRFIKTSFVNSELLGLDGYNLWEFILWNPIFWKHYEVTRKDKTGKIIKKYWVPWHTFEGLIIENLKTYWELIRGKKNLEEIILPDEFGAQIKPPPGAVIDEIVDFDISLPVSNREKEIERDRLWRENIHRLVKHSYETIETPEGPMIQLKTAYPTAEEQMEMVERLYKEKYCVN